ncbi:hypothetical protein AVEN_235592-1 [Araneus ventricosus]|uniref:Uncharacterized protein n=1 Tax=Araneus ventricosus TaxID=182803 RepID=A0A4Y2BQK6_ARAVE|nr:hypothetical protein AVEN_235592-1 [Araneus ventricosus]
MQSTLVRVGRLGRNCDYEGFHFNHERYEQPSPPSTIHPALFAWKIESHVGDKVLPTERQLKYIQMSQRLTIKRAVLSVPFQTKPPLKPGRPCSAQPILCSKQK